MSDGHVTDCYHCTPLYYGVLYLPNVTRYYGTGIRVALFALSEEYELPCAVLHQTQNHLRSVL